MMDGVNHRGCEPELASEAAAAGCVFAHNKSGDGERRPGVALTGGGAAHAQPHLQAA